MKKSLVLAMAMALGVTASAYAANPFSDVPAGHWAYDSVNKLAAAGVIDGYADGAFGGDKLMTRYEMAQIVAKAMAKGANVDKLAAEFADELDTLGVRVANLEKKADNVKITGEFRLRYWGYDNEVDTGKSMDKDATKLRSRIWINGQVNDNWTYTGMIENIQDLHNDNGDEDTKFQRAYVNGRIGGVKVQAGRYHFSDFYDAMIYDDRMDGVQLSYGKDINLTVGYGKGSDTSKTDKWENNCEDMYYAQLGAKIGVWDAKVGYYKFEDQGSLEDDNELWGVGFVVPVVKDLKLDGTYLMSDYDKNDCDDDGFMVGLKYRGAKASQVNSWGVWAKYYDMAVGTYVAPTFEADYDFGLDSEGFEGYGIGVDYTVAKNIVAAVKWYDLEGKEGSKDNQTIYGQLNFTF
ncbi:MAG: S-layer homology domain-containing protein [Phascolarctobacterium sp.]|uniref:S-layer homology domain-containing protein n=1 Tax=Phascolarctobacterium sp. TaxID=2049039 RepID=UPI0026DBFA58|nr:S-layer homology domain-containing protein [Phascolarctobacterium sp.]MDO4920412.1 S-layer homology domain-containing protein [Phascolarctobacterium sp.]